MPEHVAYKLNSRWGDVTYEHDMHVFTTKHGFISHPGIIGIILVYICMRCIDPSRFCILWFMVPFRQSFTDVYRSFGPSCATVAWEREVRQTLGLHWWLPSCRKGNQWAGLPLRSTSTFKHLHWYAFLMDGIRWIIRVYLLKRMYTTLSGACAGWIEPKMREMRPLINPLSNPSHPKSIL